MALLLLLVGIAVLLFILKQLFTNRNNALDKIPGPPRKWPILGHVPEIISTETGFMHGKWVEEYGPFVRYRLFDQDRVMVTDPAAVKYVLLNSHQFDKRIPQYTLLSKLLGNGLVTQTDEKLHKYHRGIIYPAFALRHLKGMVPIFQHKGKLLVEDWLQVADTGKPVPIKDYIAKATSDAIGEAAFGYKLNSQRNDTAASIYNLFATVASDGFSFFEMFPFVGKIWPTVFKRRKAVRVLHEQVNVILDEKTKSREEKQRQGKPPKPESEDEERVTEGRDILDILMDCQNDEGARLTREELIHQTKTFLLAGYETSSVCILWTLYMLAKNPEIQDKAAAEVLSVLGKDKTPTAEDILDKMPYLNKVMKESLRILPPIPFIIRRAAEDVTLNGYLLPQGTIVAISIYQQHHNPKYWENPEVFDPERFSNEEEEHSKLLGSYIPFIMGPRNCIGQRFASLEVRIILAMILQKLAIESYGPVPRKKNLISMTPKDPLHLIFHTRK